MWPSCVPAVTPQASLNLRHFFQHPEGCVLIPILQMGKLRLRAVKSLAQGDTPHTWLSHVCLRSYQPKSLATVSELNLNSVLNTRMRQVG